MVQPGIMVATSNQPCVRCAGEIPATLRSDAKYCSQRCRSSAKKARYCARHPGYVARQRKQVTEYRHMQVHGHTKFIDDPLLNKRDRFRVARSLGFRSLLEYTVAKQLTELGVDFQYEGITFKYEKREVDATI